MQYCSEGEIFLILDSRGLGGIESHVAELAEGLVAAGAQPRVVLLRDYGPHPLRGRLAAAGVALSVLDGGLGSLIALVRGARPAVLHSHGYKANLLARLAALICGVRQVASYHAGERPGGRVALYDALDRWTSFAGTALAVSRPIAARLPWGARVLANFVAVPAHPAPAGGAIGFAGRLSPEKAPDRFLALARALPGAAFTLFGDGPMAAAVVAEAPCNVHLAGAVPGMAPHWGEIGLLVIPSRAEGLPLAALEAMAHGVPVAAFALGGLPELIDHGRTGYLVPAGDMAGLVAAVSRFLALPEAARAAMRKAARQSIAERYGREAGVAALLKLYQPASAPVAPQWVLAR